MMSEVRCDIYLRKRGDGDLVHHRAARRHRGEGAETGIIRCHLTYISVCVQVCGTAESRLDQT